MLWCLHGFLGHGADWDALRGAWPPDLPPLRTPNLFATAPRDASLAAFGERFAREVAADDPAPMLLGYSLGGRLALHALLAQPSLWHGAVIVSAHVGLTDEQARSDRVADDAAWARRFYLGPWDEVVRDWNARGVFDARPQTLPRDESRYDNAALAHALDIWSLGRQEDLTPRLAALTMPILWIAGVDDPRYVAQGERAAASSPSVRLAVAPGAAHRVPWEAENWFRDVVVDFVRGIEG